MTKINIIAAEPEDLMNALHAMCCMLVDVRKDPGMAQHIPADPDRLMLTAVTRAVQFREQAEREVDKSAELAAAALAKAAGK